MCVRDKALPAIRGGREREREGGGGGERESERGRERESERGREREREREREIIDFCLWLKDKFIRIVPGQCYHCRCVSVHVCVRVCVLFSDFVSISLFSIHCNCIKIYARLMHTDAQLREQRKKRGGKFSVETDAPLFFSLFFSLPHRKSKRQIISIPHDHSLGGKAIKKVLGAMPDPFSFNFLSRIHALSL